jgi:3-hydroxyacyl-[acyl-carrier-protein] dehydratase
MKFRMVDRIIDYKPAKSISGVKTVSFEEYQLKSAFGNVSSLPESLIMESFFQLGNWLIILTSNFLQIGLLVRIDEVIFDGVAGPGQNMLMEINVRIYREDGVLFDGKAFVNGKEIAKGTGCLAAVTQLENYYSSEDLKVLFSEIYRPGIINER